MTINDLRIGDKVFFGAMRHEGYRTEISDLSWIKVSERNVFITEYEIAKLNVDAKEPDNSSRDRRERGSNFFPQSNLLQWLNASGRNWFHPAHDTDTVSRYADYPGFMTELTDWERDAIEPHEIAVVVPDGFRREFGVLHKTMCKVSIPAYSELCLSVDDTLKQEGEFLPYFMDHPVPAVWTRTARASTLMYIGEFGGVDSMPASDRYYVRPKICLKGNCPVSDREQDGIRFVLPMDGNESCMDTSELYQVLTA